MLVCACMLLKSSRGCMTLRVLCPLQLFCQNRVMHNVRHGWDIAKFLAEPRIEDVAGHHTNLK